jgi:hypothetical protein
LFAHPSSDLAGRAIRKTARAGCLMSGATGRVRHSHPRQLTPKRGAELPSGRARRGRRHAAHMEIEAIDDDSFHPFISSAMSEA